MPLCLGGTPHRVRGRTPRAKPRLSPRGDSARHLQLQFDETMEGAGKCPKTAARTRTGGIAVAVYPQITRNDWHGGHDYTLTIDRRVWVSLSVGEFAALKDAVHAIEELERPRTPEEMDQMRRELQEVRDGRV
jgi:hypothetical protein